MNHRKLGILIAVLIAVGLFSASAARGSASATLILDKFDGKKATEITAHTPNTDTVGDGWFVELGVWEVKKGKAKELSTALAPVSSDYRALIDSGNADVSAEVKLKVYQEGDQFWGVVARHTSQTDWLMAFHDGIGDLILGKMATGEDRFGNSGTTYFQELGRVPMDWKPGKKAKTHTITIVTAGPSITVLADGELVITADDHGPMTSGVVGIFSRGTGKNQFDQFTVKLNEPEAEPEAGGKGKGKKGKRK
jgi:hypothetical protein